jgi:flavin reductase (DIM6/NTAB) family NADH-FMN oxidoreductase RutF
VLLLITAHKGATNAMTMSWHTTLEFEPPLVGSVVIGNDFSFKALIAECDANLECRGVDPRM